MDANRHWKGRVLHGYFDAVSAIRVRPSTERPILLAGGPRSGSTWLSEMLEDLLDAFALVEPFQLSNLSPRDQESVGSWRPYRDPTTVDRDLEALFRRFFAGNHVRNRSRHLLRPLVLGHRVLVKEIRLGFLLPYVLATFPATDVILLVRNPVEVVTSQVRANSAWKSVEGLDPSYEEMIDRFPDLLAPPRPPEGAVETLATQWAMEHRYLETMAPLDGVLVLHYAALVADPRGSLLKILHHCAAGPEFVERLGGLDPAWFERPSRSTNPTTGIVARAGDDALDSSHIEDTVRRTVGYYGNPFATLDL